MIGRFLGKVQAIFKGEPEPRPVRFASTQGTDKLWRILAGYDSAKPGGVNENHWSNADNMASWSANSPEIRETLRNRARYEVANSSLAKGIVSTLANDTIGTGPMLRVDTGDPEDDAVIEDAWNAWSREAGLVTKLRTMRRARAVDGEIFAVFIDNPQLSAVTLDLSLTEADQFATPDLPVDDPQAIDGVRFDRAGNPSQYHRLRRHPGDDRSFGGELEYTRLAADQVIHYSNAWRTGEVRGVPEITPALALFAVLRRYTIACLVNAENAANIAGVIENDAPEHDPDVAPLDGIELEPNSFLALPDGYKAKGFRAEQPVSGFREFRREIVNEIARCLDMPLNIALASSQEYNFASGRLDHGVYHNSIRIERENIGRTVLDPIFARFIQEAALLGLIPEGVEISEIEHEWRWPAFPSGDPEKDAKAVKIYRELDLLSDDRFYSTFVGSDWRRETRQTKREIDYREAQGLPSRPTQPTKPTPPAASEPAREPVGVGADAEDDE